MAPKEVDRHNHKCRRKGIRIYNISLLRISTNNSNKGIPIMDTGCTGSFPKPIKARHQLICSASEGINIMILMISITEREVIDGYNDEFKKLLNTIHLDNVGTYVKNDKIVLFIGSRVFNSLRRKRHKMIGAQKILRAQVRLLVRLYFHF